MFVLLGNNHLPPFDGQPEELNQLVAGMFK